MLGLGGGVASATYFSTSSTRIKTALPITVLLLQEVRESQLDGATATPSKTTASERQPVSAESMELCRRWNRYTPRTNASHVLQTSATPSTISHEFGTSSS